MARHWPKRARFPRHCQEPQPKHFKILFAMKPIMVTATGSRDHHDRDDCGRMIVLQLERKPGAGPGVM